MPSGGKRTGAGRKAGALTNKTRVAIKESIQGGSTPLEVMLKAMRALEQEGRIVEASDIAKEVAPYVHPKLLAIEVNGKNGQPLSFRQLDVILRRLK